MMREKIKFNIGIDPQVEPQAEEDKEIIEHKEITWEGLGFNKNPFVFDESIISESPELYSSRKSETKKILEKIESQSLPFVLECDKNYEKNNLFTEITNKLLGEHGENFEENKCLPIIINSENVIEEDPQKIAFSELMNSILNDNHFADVLDGVKDELKNSSDIVLLSPELSEVSEKASDLMERFDMPNLGIKKYIKLFGNITENAQIVFIFDNLDKIKDDKKLSKFVRLWRYYIEKISNSSMIYVGDSDMDKKLKWKLPDFYSKLPIKIESIKKQDLKEILDERVKIFSDGYDNIDDFLSEDVYGLIRDANRGQDIKWILETLGETLEKYMQNKAEVKVPIQYADIKNDLDELVKEKINISYDFLPIKSRLIDIFKNSTEEITKDKLTNNDWKSIGVWQGDERLVGSEVIIDNFTIKLPITNNGIGGNLNHLEQLGFLVSKTIKTKKYYLPVNDFMLSLEIKRHKENNNK